MMYALQRIIGGQWATVAEYTSREWAYEDWRHRLRTQPKFAWRVVSV